MDLLGGYANKVRSKRYNGYVTWNRCDIGKNSVFSGT